jgi:hypothetical protein
MHHRNRICRSCARIGAILLVFGCSFAAPGADWRNSLTKDPPGKFPLLRPAHAKYNFGWSGFSAASADAHFTHSDDRAILEGTAGTFGLVRALWRFDVNYHAVTDTSSMRPVEVKENETMSGKKLVTNLVFNKTGVARTRTEGNVTPGKPTQFDFPNLYDLLSAMLYVRSQPLKDQSVYQLMVYPETTAYVATVTVSGREKISVRAGRYPAIKLDLQLKKVGKNMELEPHKKFKRATVWVSDDNDRLLLRVEAQIFVGSVFAELQSVQFEEPPSS